MRNKTRNTTIIIIISILCFIYFLFYFPAKKEYFKDTTDLNLRFSEKYKQYPFNHVMHLIPKNATNIHISYRDNRVKNITISFLYKDVDFNHYISTIQIFLNGYTMSAWPQSKKDGTIYFRGNVNEVFKQIDISICKDLITIQTF